jgi:2-dehydro-3-deoxyglucarate aldolase/4-hydroxy-2-oxoheptanedioate aldolase
MEPINKMKARLQAGEKLFGGLISYPGAHTADVYGQLGFDYIWVDTEHSILDYEALLNTVTILRARNTPAIVRVHQDDFNHTKRVLEMGVDGIIFPYIETAEEADKAIKSTLYPPLGNRGIWAQGAIGYGLQPLTEYAANQRGNLCRFVQIESKKGIDNLEEIVKNPYIDGYILGPADMSASVGTFGNLYSAENMASVKRTIEILKKHGKKIGASIGLADEKTEKFWYDLGIDFLSIASEYEYFVDGAKKKRDQALRVLGRSK